MSLQRMSTAVGLEIDFLPRMPVTTYPKILLRGQLFVSKAGSRSQKRNSSTVTYSDPTDCDKVCFGVIQKFLTIDNKECPEKILHVALVYPPRMLILALFSIKWIFLKKLTLISTYSLLIMCP